MKNERAVPVIDIIYRGNRGIHSMNGGIHVYWYVRAQIVQVSVVVVSKWESCSTSLTHPPQTLHATINLCLICTDGGCVPPLVLLKSPMISLVFLVSRARCWTSSL